MFFQTSSNTETMLSLLSVAFEARLYSVQYHVSKKFAQQSCTSKRPKVPVPFLDVSLAFWTKPISSSQKKYSHVKANHSIKLTILVAKLVGMCLNTPATNRHSSADLFTEFSNWSHEFLQCRRFLRRTGWLHGRLRASSEQFFKHQSKFIQSRVLMQWPPTVRRHLL